MSTKNSCRYYKSVLLFDICLSYYCKYICLGVIDTTLRQYTGEIFPCVSWAAFQYYCIYIYRDT